MAPLTNGTSRATTARPSRANSTVRDIMKKRDKPYKTEQQRVLAKKRKLDLHTAYKQTLPRGYIFLPVGTPDLAERCKEISRQKGYPVNVVNARPVSKFAHDPEKVSHHIARVGYHFRSEVVDEAREQLGYIIVRDHFVKEADLRKQHEDNASRSLMAETLARYGVSASVLKQNDQRETLDQVRAAIKELFPKIPERDLGEIVRHAWEEGTSRVGTNNTLELPRRVQLATIARIRHMYTDYDRLLRAFEWKEARSMVEQECLKKLIEWRGENDEEEDDGLEEIVRETIVIDDDDAPAGNASEADDEDSVTEIEPGNISDASIEITHHAAADTDFGAESVDESARRRFIDRYRPRQRELDQRRAIAKQKIDAARQHIRSGAPPRYPLPPPIQQVSTPVNAQSDAVRINIQPDKNGRYPGEVLIDGHRMRVAPVQDGQASRQRSHAFPPHVKDGHGHFLAANGTPPAPRSPAYLAATGMSRIYDLGDRPVASIERDDAMPPAGATRLRPVTPESHRSVKRQRTGQSPPSPRAYYQQPTQRGNGYAVQPYPAAAEVIDLVSPTRPGRGTRASPMVFDNSDYHSEQYEPVRHGAAMHSRPPIPSANCGSRPPSTYTSALDPRPAYDPSQALLAVSQPGYHSGPAPTAEQPPQYSYPSQPYSSYSQPPFPAPHTPVEYQVYQPPNHYAAPPPQYQQPYQQPYVAYQPPSAHPVHGAPALVQQAPIQGPGPGQGEQAYQPQHTATNGVPAQYHYGR